MPIHHNTPTWSASRNRDLVVQAIRQAGDAFDQTFPGRPPLSESRRMTLFVFRRNDAFNQVAAFDRIFRGPKPAGQYSRHDRTLYTWVDKSEHPLPVSMETLVHEYPDACPAPTGTHPPWEHRARPPARWASTFLRESHP